MQAQSAMAQPSVAHADASPKLGPHRFHIPVMGTGFTLDTPLKVARYGIDSCLSLVDDVLIEKLRAHLCNEHAEPYEKIPRSEPDHRALRITSYLNLLKKLVEAQARALSAEPFEPGSDIWRYFSLLPDGPERKAFSKMQRCTDSVRRERLERELRGMLSVGSIDVNIMTKLDGPAQLPGVPAEPKFTSAMSALRGFANSELDAAVVFSAGLNQRLYAYVAEFDDFFPDQSGHLKKRIILKVSDYRSALIQGQYLAKRGIWVSEFRVESGINCGGHAFSSRGTLLGNTLWEFSEKRAELQQKLTKAWLKALEAQERPLPSTPPQQRLTAQGGVVTGREQENLIDTFGVDSVGWGTPFLLVPEVTNLDSEHRQLLVKARSRDVQLSQSSPLGVPFWTLKSSASEQQRLQRIKRGRPGSPCPKGYCALQPDPSGKLLCTASQAYQSKKLTELEGSQLSRLMRRGAIKNVKAKACICHELGGGLERQIGSKVAAKPAVCCGPSIAYFSQLATLDQMADHVYGRAMLLKRYPRLHLFTRELLLYVGALRGDVIRLSRGQWPGQPVELEKVKANLLKQIEHYRELLQGSALLNKNRCLLEVGRALNRLGRIPLGRALKQYLRRSRTTDTV